MSVVLNIEELKQNFEDAYQNTYNKTYLVDNEIRAVENFLEIKITNPDWPDINEEYIPNHIDAIIDTNSLNIYLHSPFQKIFKSMLLRGESAINSGEENHYGLTSYEETKKDIATLFKYYTWLQTLKNPEEARKKSLNLHLTHKQKLLALYYLDLDFNSYENKAIAKVLEAVLDLSFENTRKYLTYISSGKNDVRTKNNLETVRDLFQKCGLEEIKNKIQEDIERM